MQTKLDIYKEVTLTDTKSVIFCTTTLYV